MCVHPFLISLNFVEGLKILGKEWGLGGFPLTYAVS